MQGERGEPGEPGAPGPQGPAGTALHLYNANGQDLGAVINYDEANIIQVYNSMLGAVMRFGDGVSASPRSKFITGGVHLHFEQADCQGTPVATVEDEKLQRVMKDALSAGTFPQLWMYELNETPAERVIRSRSQSEPG